MDSARSVKNSRRSFEDGALEAGRAADPAGVSHFPEAGAEFLPRRIRTGGADGARPPNRLHHHPQTQRAVCDCQGRICKR